MLLSMFCFSVPFALSSELEYYTPIASVLISFGYFSIYAVGVELEDPFGRDANDLPLTKMGDELRDDLEHILRTTQSGIHRMETMTEFPMETLLTLKKKREEAEQNGDENRLEHSEHSEQSEMGSFVGSNTSGSINTASSDKLSMKRPLLKRSGNNNPHAGHKHGYGSVGSVPYSLNDDEEASAQFNVSRAIEIKPPERGKIVS
eukprot:TRINITY_DN1052_c0_g2_i2.p2 TRINITY_DN1052_c0_g2~~TRINITY_DN1052_c0_g2_i2.p2  ORF type:complete len:204 (-),score=64.55 TRINITY_DN1052_c0_g2_i2:561-1172(-)